jgi:hypothetical protein
MGQDAREIEERLVALEARLTAVEADNTQMRRVLGSVGALLDQGLLSAADSAASAS